MYLDYHSQLPKEKLLRVTGRIIDISRTHGPFPLHDVEYYRYINLTGQRNVFELYSDEAKVLNHVDNLHKGEMLVIWIDRMPGLTKVLK